MYQPEILAPAGSYAAFLAAVHNGCDAVYLSGDQDGARAYAKNFDDETLKKVVAYAALFGVKIYYAMNTLFKEKEMAHLFNRINQLRSIGIHTFIVQDIGVLSLLHTYFPDIDLHGSTQINCHSSHGVAFLKKLGVSRVVLARELSLKEIQQILITTSLEIETFIHGAMCYCYSGQCLMSSFLGGRSGNRGRCAQPCRLSYQPKNKKKVAILSLKDMETLSLLPELIDSQITSLKIEGRMKSPEYVGLMTHLYKYYRDLYHEKGEITIQEEDYQNMQQVFNRGDFFSGYYTTLNGPEMITMIQPKNQGRLIGHVRHVKGEGVTLDLMAHLTKGDLLSVLLSTGKWYEFILDQDVTKESGYLQIRESVKKHAPVRRISSIQLTQTLQKKNQTIPKESLSMTIILRIGQPAKLELFTKKKSIQVEGVLVEQGRNQSLSEENIKKQCLKVAHYPVIIVNINIQQDENIFLPISQLNQLRRKGFERWFNLLEKITMPVAYPKQKQISSSLVKEGEVSVLVKNKIQFQSVSGYKVTRIYLDLLTFNMDDLEEILSAKQDQELFLVLPKIIREKDEPLLERLLKRFAYQVTGFLIRSIDMYEYIKAYKRKIIWDQDLSIMNNRTVDFYQGLEKCSIYMPSLELNKHELQILDLTYAEILIYGHVRVMTSAQCVIKNTEGCRIDQGRITYLEDRKHIQVPVETLCNMCYNRIYNGVPHFLIDKKNSLQTLGIRRFRIEFLEESVADIHKIMQQVMEQEKQFAKPKSFTRGHFNKGVI